MPKLANTRPTWTPTRLARGDAQWRYFADPHFNHANILRFCHRPFADVGAMNVALLSALRAAEASDPRVRLVVPGDIAFNLTQVRATYGWLARPEAHIVVIGNHDAPSKHRAAYDACFGTVIGTERTWAAHSVIIEDEVDGVPCDVLVSHDPQPNLHGCAWNVHGHYHDNLLYNPAFHDLQALRWLLDSTQHLNASVECIGYTPQPLAALVATQGRSSLRSRIPDLTAVRSARPL